MLSAPGLFSQTLPSWTQYHFNQLILNPAYAGSRGTLEANAFLHSQWRNMDGAPETQSVSVHSMLADGRIGLGFQLYHDHIGIEDNYHFALDYAYRFYTYGGAWAVGIQAAVANIRANYQKLDTYGTGDPAFENTRESVWKPDAGAGIWYNSKRYYFGLSVPDLVNEGHAFGEGNFDTLVQGVHVFSGSDVFLSSGYLFNVSPHFALKPYTLVKYSEGSPVQIDGSLSMIFYDALWVGGTYRTDQSLSVLLEYVVGQSRTLADKELSFGYSINFRTQGLGSYFGPTHELFLAWRFNRHNTKIVNPRFF